MRQPEIASPRGRPRPDRGFTLVEVIIATLLLGMVVVSAGWAMHMAARTRAIYEEKPYEAAILAREIHELAKLLPREPSGIQGVTSGESVVALDSLVGAEFSPPIRADKSTDAARLGWTQSVDLDLSALGDGSIADLDAGLDVDAEALDPVESLIRLNVTISYLGKEVESFEWWLAP